MPNKIWKSKTKKGLLKEAIAYVQKYLNKPDADLEIVSAYLVQLSNWISGPSTQSNPPDTPPPPPGTPGGGG